MQVLSAVYYFAIQEILIETESAIEHGDRSPELADRMLAQITMLEESSAQIELKRTREQLEDINKLINEGPKDDQKLKQMYQFLRLCLQRDLRERKMYIPTIEQAEYFNQPKLFGDKVYDKFESARSDILECGNCYATDNFTACVFHLMRVAERGMRSLAAHLKIKKIGKHTVEFSDWGSVSRALRIKLEVLQQRKGRSVHKSALLSRYADAAWHADYMNELYRKDLAHARERRPYNGPEALSALTRVREFMEIVAGWIGEPKKPI